MKKYAIAFAFVVSAFLEAQADRASNVFIEELKASIEGRLSDEDELWIREASIEMFTIIEAAETKYIEGLAKVSGIPSEKIRELVWEDEDQDIAPELEDAMGRSLTSRELRRIQKITEHKKETLALAQKEFAEDVSFVTRIPEEEILAMLWEAVSQNRPEGADEEALAKAERALHKWDRNQDGKITKEEAGEDWQRLYRADLNRDGVATRQELIECAPRKEGDQDVPSVDRMFRQDTNRDEKLTKEEILKAWPQIYKADRDGDGAVSREELIQFYKERQKELEKKWADYPPESRRFFDAHDANEDGKITKGEVASSMWKQICKADSDHDGGITIGEYTEFQSKRNR